MAMERVLEFSLGLFKRNPKVALPNVLNWIPSALLSILILQAASAVGAWNIQSVQQALGDTALLLDMLKTILAYAVIAIPIVIASAVVSSILACVYSDVARQAYTRRKVKLIGAFSIAKSRFLSLLWTYVLEFLVVVLTFVALVGLGLVVGATGILIAMVFGVIAILLAVFFFYETPAVVVLENKSGLEAIKRSYEIARHNFWPLVIITLIVGIIASTVTSGLNNVPYVGFILSNVAGLFLGAWNSMTPALFYYEYEKGG